MSGIGRGGVADYCNVSAGTALGVVATGSVGDKGVVVASGGAAVITYIITESALDLATELDDLITTEH